MIVGDYEKLSCLREDGVSRIDMDYGKVKAVSPGLLDELN